MMKNSLKLGVEIVYDKDIVKDIYGVEKEEDIKKKLWEKVKEINKKMPKYKYIKRDNCYRRRIN